MYVAKTAAKSVGPIYPKRKSIFIHTLTGKQAGRQTNRETDRHAHIQVHWQDLEDWQPASNPSMYLTSFASLQTQLANMYKCRDITAASRVPFEEKKSPIGNTNLNPSLSPLPPPLPSLLAA